jgi:inosine-uridine nucleoside N-ribohydrolase
MTMKIIIDTDPGVDDAMAILFALRSPELKIVGLTTVFGNAPVPVTSLNALRLMELESHEQIPVAKGAGHSLMSESHLSPTMIHGEDGLGNLFLPPPEGEPISIHAAQYIVETVLSNPGEITLVPVGPLTNIALALTLEPGIAEKVNGVVIMGGAAWTGGNISPMAEANIYNDPHAASLVFKAGWPLVMVGLDVTKKTIMTKEYLTDLGTAGNPAVDFITRIIPCYQDFHRSFYPELDGEIHTHDPSAIGYLIAPELFKTVKTPVVIETEGRCRGKTIAGADFDGEKGNMVDVCADVDSAAFLDLFRERLSKKYP